MAKFHFVEDYEKLVKRLIETKPLDEAMSAAVGGGYEEIGLVLNSAVIYAGLEDGMKLVDYGCGSGRLACRLGESMKIQYLGIDIVDELLEYAASKTPASYQYLKHHELNVPAEDDSADMVCAFSLFTHLLQAESYLYINDMYRVLRSGGRLVFSFLEFDMDMHWSVFEGTVEQQRRNNLPHLNMFMERNVIELWAEKIGFKVVEIISGDAKHFDGKALGQSVVILEK